MQELILMIEDNDDDVLMIKRAFKKGKLGNRLHRSENGKEGLEYLESKEGKEVGLILLDLNMEVMNGFDFLRKRHDIQDSYKIPVVVLTSSHRTEDIQKAYELGANCYIEKPFKPADFIEAILKIEDFWIYFSKRP